MMATEAFNARGALLPCCPGKLRLAMPFKASSRSPVRLLVCRCTDGQSEARSADVQRRSVLLGISAAALVLQSPAFAIDGTAPYLLIHDPVNE